MFKNYLKIALRNLQRNRIYSLINISGLTIGLGACLLVATVVFDDLSYDRQWKNSVDIYRIISVNNNNKNAVDKFAQSYSGLGPTLKSSFPEVAGYCRLSNKNQRIRIGSDKDGVVLNGLSTEPSVWNMFDFIVTAGNPKKFVKGYANLVISEKIKKQFFPNTDPTGQIVYTIPEFGKPTGYLITGVIKDMPSNTHLRADVLEINEYRTTDDQLYKDGNGTFYQQYLLLKPGTAVSVFTAKVNKWYKNYVTDRKPGYTFEFQPLKDIYLHSDFPNAQPVQGSMRTVYMFTGVAVLLLLIACINFVNLTTARALKRLREAGIRKVLGAGKKELIGQFLLESLVFFFISFTLAIVFYNISIQWVEIFLGHPLYLKLYANVSLFTLTCGFVLLVSVFTGLYPAFLLSGRHPAESISGKLSEHTGSGVLRKCLVVIQFTISICIIIAAVVVRNQLQYIDHKDLGFDKNNLVSIDFSSWEGKGNVFKNAILTLPGVENASICGWTPSNGGGSMSVQFDDPSQKNSKITVWYIEGDIDLTATLKLQLKQGRMLDPHRTTDALNTDSLYQHLDNNKVHQMQLLQPILITSLTAKTFNISQLTNKGNLKEGTPVGVIKDFNNEDLHTPMKPVVIRAVSNPDYGYMLIRLNPHSTRQALTGIARSWEKFYPQKVFKYNWVDETLKAQYKTEQKLQQLFTFFSLLIVFLACLGLFGLITFTAEQRTKEIGIRKVLGASVTSIVSLLSSDFLKLVFVAMLIAAPIAWFAMNKWLEDFAYRINIGWFVFAMAGAFVMVIALITISTQVINAAMANPAKSLRSE